MKAFFGIVVLFLLIGLPSAFGWSEDEYAKIKSSVASNPDTNTASGELINSAAKAADVAMFYHQQGNVDLADQWLAVAWQDFQQAQAPAQTPAPSTGKDSKITNP